jgi:hypothetical protein
VRVAEVDGADAVPELEAKEIDAPERFAIRAFAVTGAQAMTDRRAVVVSDHVVSESNIPLKCKVGGATGS